MFISGLWDLSFQYVPLNQYFFGSFSSAVHHLSTNLISISGNYIACGSNDKTISIYEYSQAEIKCNNILSCSDADILALAISSKHNLLVYGDQDGKISIYGLHTGDYTRDIEVERDLMDYEKHEEYIIRNIEIGSSGMIIITVEILRRSVKYK